MKIYRQEMSILLCATSSSQQTTGRSKQHNVNLSRLFLCRMYTKYIHIKFSVVLTNLFDQTVNYLAFEKQKRKLQNIKFIRFEHLKLEKYQYHYWEKGTVKQSKLDNTRTSFNNTVLCNQNVSRPSNFALMLIFKILVLRTTNCE